jgi:internalin A
MNAIQEEATAVQKKNTRQANRYASATAPDPMAEAERRIAEARRQHATELDLSHLRLTEVPAALGQLQQLQKLHLRNNQLVEVPAVLGELQQLQELFLGENQLREVTDTLAELRQLRWLSLLGNQLQTMPRVVYNLEQLEVLGLGRNELEEIPSDIYELRKLQRLYLWNNRLKEIPPTLGMVKQLSVLSLFNNQVREIPASLGNLHQLRELFLNNNQLQELPAALSGLQQLQKLELSANQLRELPAALGELQQIEELFLNNNQLRKLPVTFRECKKLVRLFLHGNPDLGIPAEILGPRSEDVDRQKQVLPANPADILDYYFRPKRPLLEAKLILVGRGAVGKTSLVNRLVHNTFGKEKKTEGIKITGWDVPLLGGDQAHLNVWDFGGQEIMHATHQFFLTRRSLYLLVLSGREGNADQDAEYWLKLIESFGGESPTLVVLNKQREHPFDVNQRQLRGKYPFIRGFLKTDCGDCVGLDDLRRRIEQEINALPHLRDGFPSEWFAVKDRLPRLRRNFVSFDQYRKVCRGLQVTSEAQQNLLGRYLHDLGVMLNFREDERLQDTHVLKPHWVTEGIYTIINAPQLAEHRGELRMRDLKGILPDKDYPSHMHPFILDLMKKFELCFTFPDEDTHFLIPELLDIQEPEVAAEFNPEKCLNFRYEYEVLPEGLLPRFIVRTHGLIEDEHRWRTGVILRFEEGRALVKADVVDKKVFIRVAGQSEARRRLLAVIRSDFERIHADMKFRPVELVPLHEHPDEFVTYDELLVYEQNGVKTFPKVVDKKIIHIDVQELLNGVDLTGTRRREDRREELAEMREEPIRVFISYAHKDERFRLALEPHLKLLQRQRLIATWHDRLIKPGAEWADVIDANLEHAKIVLLMVSADFIASDYCWEVEMKRAVERHEEGEARVIPVIIRDAKWDTAPFAKLQALPAKGKAVDLWRKKDEAWRSVADGIEKVAIELRKKKNRATADSE